MKGLIFSIKRYSIHDGTGIRVTFFLKGCPLSCMWCHNPEGISPEPEEITETRRAGGREFIRRRNAGSYYSVGDLLAVAERERVFIEKSGGGVTFSGGEPLMQSDFLLEALMEMRRAGFHTAVDTSGYYSGHLLEKILPFTNLFLYDIKHLNPEKHLQYTGVSNDLILKNLSLIMDSGTDIMLRIPVIPGINDDDENIAAMVRYIGEINNGKILTINLLPYHRRGVSKYHKLNREDKIREFLQPSVKEMDKLKNMFSVTGIKVKTGG